MLAKVDDRPTTQYIDWKSHVIRMKFQNEKKRKLNIS